MKLFRHKKVNFLTLDKLSFMCVCGLLHLSTFSKGLLNCFACVNSFSDQNWPYFDLLHTCFSWIFSAFSIFFNPLRIIVLIHFDLYWPSLDGLPHSPVHSILCVTKCDYCSPLPHHRLILEGVAPKGAKFLFVRRGHKARVHYGRVITSE